MIITNSRFALVGYFITSYPTRANGIIVIYSPTTECIMRKPNKNKMAGVNSRFASVSESEILKIQEDAVPENTKKATKFGMKVFRGKRRLNICTPVFYRSLL